MHGAGGAAPTTNPAQQAETAPRSQLGGRRDARHGFCFGSSTTGVNGKETTAAPMTGARCSRRVPSGSHFECTAYGSRVSGSSAQPEASPSGDCHGSATDLTGRWKSPAMVARQTASADCRCCTHKWGPRMLASTGAPRSRGFVSVRRQKRTAVARRDLGHDVLSTRHWLRLADGAKGLAPITWGDVAEAWTQSDAHQSSHSPRT